MERMSKALAIAVMPSVCPFLVCRGFWPTRLKRAAIFSQIQKLLIDDGPSIIPYFQPLFYAQAKNVGGITISPDPGLTSFATATVS